MTKKKTDKSVQREIDISNAYKTFFSTNEGLIVLQDLMKKGKFLADTVDPLPHITSRNEGQRELVVYIIAKTNESPEKLLDFIKNCEESGEENPL